MAGLGVPWEPGTDWMSLFSFLRGCSFIRDRGRFGKAERAQTQSPRPRSEDVSPQD